MQRPRLSYYQAAERYGVTVATIYKWRSTGKMPDGFMLGGRRFFWLDELEAWETNNFQPESIEENS